MELGPDPLSDLAGGHGMAASDGASEGWEGGC